MSWLDRIIIKFRNFPLNDESLDGVIGVFENLFEECSEKNNFFSNLESNISENSDASFQLIQLREIEKAKVDKFIKETRNGLKYVFLTCVFQKKANLELIKKLSEILKKINNKIKEQDNEKSFLEQNNLLINGDSKINNNNGTVTNIKTFLDFCRERIINDVWFLQEINLILIENKKIFLKKTEELENEINQKIEELRQKNKKLEIQSKKIFEILFKEATITQFILSFWAFRMKNDNHEYTIDVEDRNLKDENNEITEKFLFSLKLIDGVFNKYLKKIINNEEKICVDIFQKFSDQKKKFKTEEKELIKNQEKIQEKIEQLEKEIAAQNQEVDKYKKELDAKQNQIKNLKKWVKKIRNKKRTYLEDQQLSKDNLWDQVSIENDLDEKTAKKQYLRKLEKLVEETEECIKKNKSDSKNLKYNIKTNETELDNNNDRIENIKVEIIQIQFFNKKNEHMMLFELQKIKEKWITKIAKNQKDFIEFLRKNNKLKDTEFIELLDECWRVNKDQMLLFNENFDLENNLQVLKDQREKIENEFKDDFKNLEVDFKLKEEEIMESATKKKADNLQNSLKKINQSEIRSIETQTEINTEEGKPSWSEQKINEQNKTIKILEGENENYQKKLILIKGTLEDETKELMARLETIGDLLIKEKDKIEKACEELKESLHSKLQTKKEKEIKIQLNELEIKLAYVNELLNKVSNEIPSSQFLGLTESKDKNESDWNKINLDDANELNIESSVTNFNNGRFIT